MDVPLAPAPQLVRAFRLLKEGQSASSISDEDIREIMMTGELYVFRVADSALGFQQLIITILEERRRAIVAGRG